MGLRRGTLENMELDALNYYRNKTVLITGHTGFKGSWLALMISRLGGKVFGVALPNNEQSSIYCESGVSSQITNEYFVDIRNYGELNEAVNEISPQIVFHLAAQPLVRKSYNDPIDTFSTNIMGTANLLNTLISQPRLTSVVNITTDKVYKNKEWVWGYRETDELGGADPYAASKACSELITRSYEGKFRTQKAGLVTARAGNVIGGGDWSEDRLVPDAMRSITNSDTLLIRNPNSVRPWQHVLDALMPYLILGYVTSEEPVKYAGSWNFAPQTNDAIKVIDIINLLQRMLPEISYTIADNISQDQTETNLLNLNSDKARRYLGWNSKLTLEESIEKTARWYWVARQKNNCIQQETNNQITEYLELFE